MSIQHSPGSIVGLPKFPAPTDFPDSPLSQALVTQPVLLGLFLPIQAVQPTGASITTRR